MHFVPDEGAVTLLQKDAADDETERGNGHRINEPGIDVAGGGTEADADHGQQAAEDSVANMVGQ